MHFDDIDFARIRPGAFVDIGTQRPEGRPHTGTRRHLDARLDIAVSDIQSIFGGNPGGGN